MIKIVIRYCIHIMFTVSVLNAQSYIRPNEPKRLSQYVIDQFQVKDGLPQNSVNAIVQTRDGYLWFGTYEGLVRFNGRQFSVFDRSNTPQLASNRITSLAEDRSGRLWIGTYGGGVSLFDGRMFRKLEQDSTRAFSYVSIKSMTRDSTGRIWMITEKGVMVFDQERLDTVYRIESFGHQFPSFIVTDRRGRVWLQKDGMLFISENDTLRRIPPSGVGWFAADIVPDSAGGIAMFELDRRYRFRFSTYGDSWKTEAVSDKPDIPFNVLRLMDSRGALWGSYSTGIIKYERGYWDKLSAENGLIIEDPQVMMEDREGNIWIGTNGSGLFRFRDARFTTIGKAEGLPKENVWSVFEDSRRRKWIGVMNGGCYYLDTNGIHSLKDSDGAICFAFLEDRNGTLWIEGNETIDRYGKRTKPTTKTYSSVMTMDSSGGVLAALLYGSIKIGRNGVFHDSLLLGNTVADNTIRTMRTDHDGSLWIGTQAGLFHLSGGRVKHFTRADGLPNEWIRSVHQDDEGTIWAATDGGLARKIGERFLAYTSADGLHSNTIHVILEDDHRRLWMSSNKGIFVVAKADLDSFDRKEIRRIRSDAYGESDGMRSAEGNGSFQQGGWRMKDGTLWFGTIKGVVVVDPERLKKNKVIPAVVIEKILINGKEHHNDTIPELPYPTEEITVHFAALSYSVPTRVRIRYMLEGYQQDWIDAGEQHYATFSRLPAGVYTFRVIACNDDGVWNMDGASFSFTLPAPFWERWWFIGIGTVLMFTAFAGAIRFIERQRVRRRIERLEQERTLERERSRISQDMHDEVGSSLTQIAILSELAKRSDNKGSASHLEKISSTSREVIDNISQIIWAVDPKNDTLENLLAYIREYSVETMDISPILLTLDFPESVPETKVSAEFRRNIFLVLKESLNNSIKYSSATECSIRAVLNGHRFLMTVRDNGVGFNTKDISRFGNGLTNMKKRIEDLRGTFSIESSQGVGTTVRWDVPITTFV